MLFLSCAVVDVRADITAALDVRRVLGNVSVARNELEYVPDETDASGYRPYGVPVTRPVSRKSVARILMSRPYDNHRSVFPRLIDLFCPHLDDAGVALTVDVHDLTRSDVVHLVVDRHVPLEYANGHCIHSPPVLSRWSPS
jgi:hypothetical protein